MYGVDLANTMKRLRLINPDEPVKDEDGNITVYAPVAQASAAATVVNPERSEKLGNLCGNCKGIFTVGIEVAYPPPHSEAEPVRVCANCLTNLCRQGQVLRMDWV